MNVPSADVESRTAFEQVLDEISRQMRSWLENHSEIIEYFIKKVGKDRERVVRWLFRCGKKRSKTASPVIEGIRKWANENFSHKICKNWLADQLQNQNSVILNFISYSVFRLSEAYNGIYYEAIQSKVVPKETMAEIKTEMFVPFGMGTVGYLARIGKPVNIGNTYADLRGALAMGDFMLGNVSFMACPVFEYDSPDDEKRGRLICIVCCFFPAENAFNDGIFNKFQEIVKDNSMALRISWKLEQWKAISQKFEKLTTLKEDVTQGYAGILKTLLPKHSDFSDPLGASVCTVWDVDEGAKQLRFREGSLNEPIFLTKFIHLIQQSSVWRPKEQRVWESYLNGLGWDRNRGVWTFKRQSEHFDEIGSTPISWDVEEKETQGEFLPIEQGEKIFISLYDKYNQEYNEKEGLRQTRNAKESFARSFKQVEDLVVPLIYKTGEHELHKLGFLRINCFAERRSILEELKRRIADVYEAFEPLSKMLWQIREVSKTTNLGQKGRKRRHELKKICSELETELVSIVADYLVGSKKHDKFFDSIENFLDIFIQIMYSYIWVDEKEIEIIRNNAKNLLKDKLGEIRNILTDVKSILVAISIWLFRRDEPVMEEEPVFLEVKNGEPQKYKWNRSEFAQDYRYLKDEFEQFSTFEVQRKLTNLALENIDAKRKQCNPIPLKWEKHTNYEGILHATMLAKPEGTWPGFQWLHVCECPSEDKKFISIYSNNKVLEAEQIEKLIRVAYSPTPNETVDEQFDDGIYLICVWKRRPKLEFAAFECLEEAIRSIFFESNPTKYAVLDVKDISRAQFDLLSEKRNVLIIHNASSGGQISLEERRPCFIYVSRQSKEKNGQKFLDTDEVNPYLGLFDAGMWKHNDRDTDVYVPDMSLIEIMGLRSVFCQPIFVDDKLRSIIFMYSVYMDSANEKALPFDNTVNQNFGRIVSGFCEGRFILERVIDEGVRADVGAGMFHNLAHYILPLKEDSSSIRVYAERGDNTAVKAIATKIEDTARRLDRFQSAVQRYVKHRQASPDETKFQSLEDVPRDALLIPTEAFLAVLRWVSRDYNAGVDPKWWFLVKHLLPGAESLSIGMDEQRQKITQIAACFQQNDLPRSADFTSLARWWKDRFGLDISVKGHSHLKLLRGDVPLITGVVEELLLNALGAAAEVLAKTRRKNRDVKDLPTPHIVIEAVVEPPSSSALYIKNLSSKVIPVIKKPEADSGWGLYGMKLLMEKCGGDLDIWDNGQKQHESKKWPLFVGFKIILPRGAYS